MDHHVKSINTDSRSNKRFRFASSKKRSKRASADVYRSYKRRIGVTSAASREERVHFQERASKRHKQERTNKQQELEREVDVTEATFTEELDLAYDRNPSETFRNFYREVWPLSRSLPEVLHHAAKIVPLLLAYLLSNASEPHAKSTNVTTSANNANNNKHRERFVLNHSSADILHLLAVLAKDLRHEIHPYLHTQIMPRFVTDLLNPPTTTGTTDPGHEDPTNKQLIPLDVSIIEAAFRSLSYIFRYDAEALLAEKGGDDDKKEACLECLRQYYGVTLAHRRDVVRRLAAEAFAPLIRKLKQDSARKRHLRRVLKALMTVSATTKTNATASARRLETNAVDGISHLFFEVARGVAGQLHSKGKVAVKVLLEVLTDSNHHKDTRVIHSVTSFFLDKLCHHLDANHLDRLLEELTGTTQRVLQKLSTDSEVDSDFFGPAEHMMGLLDQLVLFREGRLLKPGEATRTSLLQCVVHVLEVMVPLLSKDTIPVPSRDALLKLLCSTWKAVPTDQQFAKKVQSHVDRIAQQPSPQRQHHPAQVLARELIPHLPVSVAMGMVGASILSAAAKAIETNLELGLSMLLAVAHNTAVRAEEGEEASPSSEDSLFSFQGAEHCRVSFEVRQTLLKACLLPLREFKFTEANLNQLGVAARCISFVALTGSKKEEEEQNTLARKSSLEKALKWLLGVFTTCSQQVETVETDADGKENDVVSASLALESFASLAMQVHEQHPGSTNLKRIICKAQKSAESLLLAQSKSLWTLKCCAAYVQCIQLIDLALNKRDEIFDALVPNLRSASHFRRLYSLQILGSFPKKPFVTDHASLDFSDDLDEETTDFAGNEGNKSVARSGLCDILDTMIAIESTFVAFEGERQLLSLISRIEILGRTTKLPVVYTEAAANHMLGVLNIKFSPIWAAAVRAFVSLANGQDTFIWSPLQEQITILMRTFPTPPSQTSEPDVDEEASRLKANHLAAHHSACKLWDRSNGTDVSLFGKDVSDHLPTDSATVLQHLWSVLEGAPQLLTKHNRKFVPIFLQFMHSQFYSFYSHDPDARELRIEDHIEDQKRFDRQLLQSHVIHQRLISILKVFASVKGPKQLYKHGLLLTIYTALLSQETAVAQLAFSCILTYKLPCLIDFSHNIEALFAKGGLREGLLKFTTTLESSDYDRDQRHHMLPLVTRVLFGRMSSRAGGSKSSKDSPSARRAAVLAFMAVLCENDEELYSFIYLMMRSYVATSCQLLPVEQHDEAAKSEFMKVVKNVSVDDLASLPVQVHIGFLHLLEPVIGQLGHRVANFVEQFTSIILCLCKLAEIQQPPSGGGPLATTDEDENAGDENDIEGKSSKGFGTIRTLCFRRLSELFAQFSQVVDFSQYRSSLWNAIKRSVRKLPETVVQCDKVPALLSFLQTLSSHSKLTTLLTMNDEPIPCVIKCLADTSSHPVVDTTLSFIDNLLGDEELGTPCLVKEHVDLILRQFMVRLGSKSTIDGPYVPSGNSFKSGNKAKRSVTWRRELRILCRITDIVGDAPTGKGLGDDGVADKLCALLTPYLEQGNGVTESDQMNVLRILEALIPKVGVEAGASYFQQLARLLGPSKGKPGIVSVPVRHSVAVVIGKTPLPCQDKAAQVSRALQSLCKSHTKRVDEMDYDSVIPALSNLVDGDSDTCWRALATGETETNPSLISPIISTCFHYLFNDDGVVSRGSFKALKTLIGLAATEAGLTTDDIADNKWIDLLEKSLVPSVRTGLSSRNTAARRYYILLIAEVASACRDSSNPNLYGDLSALIRDDEPDLDFFLNITHVQMHRRTRAFQRLRKALVSTENESECDFSLQALSNVLLPIALHPIYESHTKAEEPFAIEAIATVGAISRHLSWSKYSATLWTSLTQFQRHSQQERFLVGMICALIDGFHFDIAKDKGATTSAGEASDGENAIWRALEKRFIPKIEALLSKESVDRNGTKVKTLRASLILALVKLFKKFDKEIFESRLPRLLTVICDGLQSRESDARDVARTTLAKVAVDIDIAYLPDILREVAIALNDGFRLHVRMATVHSILLAVSEVYSPPMECSDEEAMGLSFDRSVPALMDIIQQDLFGVAQERKDVVGAQTRYVKEAGGSKSQNSIELVASLIVFRPSILKTAPGSHSSIHALVSPLLERLKALNVEVATIRRVKECLTRLVAGLSRNPSITLAEVLPFVYATAAPFIGVEDFTASLRDDEDSSDEEEEALKPLHVSGGTKKQTTPTKPEASRAGSVANWRPASLKASRTSKHASSVRQKEATSLRKVQDGASAPKLTGSSRYASAVTTSRINDPANIAAVVFSLRLLYSILKKRKMTASEPKLVALVDPFVPMLTTCVCTCRETDVVLLALRCLGIFLVFDVPSKDGCAPSLGSKTLELLGSSGVGSNQDNDLSQACFKMLILLMNIDQSKIGRQLSSSEMIEGGEGVLSGSQVMPLDSEQMKVLISFLQESIVDSENHNAALNLIKAMMSRRFVSPEFYDLMDTVLELSVRSPRASLREQCAGIVINYLLNYPLGEERLEANLKQIVMNVKYEYEEGRQSGINLTSMVVNKVPQQVLEKYVQLFFLPLTLQMSNDDSEKCRQGVAACLSSLLRRVSTDVVQSLYDFARRWSKGNADVQRASLQLFGIFVEACNEFMKRGDTVANLVKLLKDVIVKKTLDDEDWEGYYFSLLCLEKLDASFPRVLSNQPDLWRVIVKCLAHSHPFVKLVSNRLISQHLETLDVDTFVDKAKSSFLIQIPGSLYETARNLCFQLNAEEDHQSDDATALCIKSLCWILPAMKQHPYLCYADQKDNEQSDKSPVGWVMKRLAGIAKPKGPKRRQAVFKAFGAFASKCPEVIFPTHLELILEPLHRVDVETTNDSERPQIVSQQRRGAPPDEGEGIPEEASLARDVLGLLEEKCESDVFLAAYAATKTRAREKKESRKLEMKSEAVRDPSAAAKRRQEKNEREKKRKKRRVEDRRRERGALGKGKRRYTN